MKLRNVSTARLSFPLASAIATLLAATSAHAADGTWNGITGNWSNTATWAGGTLADGVDSTANFTGVDITADQTITLDSNRTIGNITFTDATTSTNNLAITSNILTLDRTAGVPVIDVTQASRSLSISSVVAGIDGLQKDGAGNLTLSAVNTYIGATTINGGTLEFSGNVDATSPYQSAQININNGSTLKITGATYMPVFNGKQYNFDANGGGSILLGTGNYYSAGGALGITTTGGARNNVGLISTSSGFSFNIGPAVATFNVALGTDSTSDLTITPSIVNTGSIVKNGTGRLTLNAQNTYSGATTINEGTLKIGSTGRLGSAGTYAGAISIASGAALELNGTNQVLTGNISGAGAITKNGSANLELSGSNKSHSGVITVNEGRLFMGSLSSASSFVINSATGNGAQFYGGWNIPGATFVNDFALSGLGLQEGGVAVGAIRASSNQIFSGTITLAGASRIGMVDSGNFGSTISGRITGNYGLDLQGSLTGNNSAMTMTLANAGSANDFTGDTSISVADFAGPRTGIKTVLKMGASNQIPNGAGKGNLVFNGANADHQTIYELNGHSDTINGLSNTAAAGAIIRNTTAGSSTLTIGDADTTSNFSGSITDGGAGSTLAITKIGTGTLTFSGVSTHSGPTTVSQGKLVVNGSISTSMITVASGATLGGQGTVGKTTINGTLAVGNSPGTMTFTDTLSLTGSVITEIDGTAGAGVTGGHDFVNLTGAGAAGLLSYGGTMTLDMGVAFGVGTYSWNLFDMASETGAFSAISLADQYSGNLLDTDVNGVWDLTSGNNTWQFTQSTGVLDLAVIPETSTALLGCLGALALLRRRRN